MNKRLALAAIALIGAVAVFGLLAKDTTPEVDGPTSAASGVCETNGVSLVVDFGEDSGNETIATCNTDFAGNGWQLLVAAGLNPEGTSQYPEAFVCRLGMWPSAEEQDCLDTPSYAEGSWVYFKTLENGAWVRSGQGAADPANQLSCGDSEGWVFVTPDTPESSQIPSITAPVFDCQVDK